MEFNSQEAFSEEFYSLLVEGFDDLQRGSELDGSEFDTFTIFARRIAVVDPTDFAPGLIVGGANLQSFPNGISASIFYNSSGSIVFDNLDDTFTIEFHHPMKAVGVFVGNLGASNNDPNTQTVITAFNADDEIVASSALTQASEGLIGTGANNRIFYGVSSDDGIQKLVVDNGPSDGDGIILDDVQYVPLNAETEKIEGTPASEEISGGESADQICAGLGDDTITGAGGNDVLEGEGGEDTAVFDGDFGNYILTIDGSSRDLLLSDKRADGTGDDTLKEVELLQFGDGFSFDGSGAFDLREITGAVGLSEEELLTFVEMYVAYFDRAPDALGLLYWGTRLADGLGLGQIAQSFFFQEETLALYPELVGLGGVSDPSSLSTEFYSQLVTDIYNRLLERNPDAQGQSFWVGELESGSVRLGEFVLAIINGAKDFDPDGATPDEIAQAAADTLTIEQKGQLGYAFAVEEGMSNVDNARDVMEAYDIGDREGSISIAEALIADYRLAAEADGNTEIIIEVAQLGVDPFGFS